MGICMAAADSCRDSVGRTGNMTAEENTLYKFGRGLCDSSEGGRLLIAKPYPGSRIRYVGRAWDGSTSGMGSGVRWVVGLQCLFICSSEAIAQEQTAGCLEYKCVVGSRRAPGSRAALVTSGGALMTWTARALGFGQRQIKTPPTFSHQRLQRAIDTGIALYVKQALRCPLSRGADAKGRHHAANPAAMATHQPTILSAGVWHDISATILLSRLHGT
jgi:hypothetical protein